MTLLLLFAGAGTGAISAGPGTIKPTLIGEARLQQPRMTGVARIQSPLLKGGGR